MKSLKQTGVLKKPENLNLSLRVVEVFLSYVVYQLSRKHCKINSLVSCLEENRSIRQSGSFYSKQSGSFSYTQFWKSLET